MSDSSYDEDLGNLALPPIALPEKIHSYKIILKAKVMDGCTRFSVNFCSDNHIVYHFGMRDNLLCQNAKVDGKDWHHPWESDETWEHPASGIVEQVFQFRDKAQVEHNGNHYDFSHEIPFSSIKRIELRGDIASVQELTFKWGDSENGV